MLSLITATERNHFPCFSEYQPNFLNNSFPVDALQSNANPTTLNRHEIDIPEQTLSQFFYIKGMAARKPISFHSFYLSLHPDSDSDCTSECRTGERARAQQLFFLDEYIRMFLYTSIFTRIQSQKYTGFFCK